MSDAHTRAAGRQETSMVNARASLPALTHPPSHSNLTDTPTAHLCAGRGGGTRGQPRRAGTCSSGARRMAVKAPAAACCAHAGALGCGTAHRGPCRPAGPQQRRSGRPFAHRQALCHPSAGGAPSSMQARIQSPGQRGSAAPRRCPAAHLSVILNHRIPDSTDMTNSSPGPGPTCSSTPLISLRHEQRAGRGAPSVSRALGPASPAFAKQGRARGRRWPRPWQSSGSARRGVQARPT